jgi:hypothetical protein
VGATDDGRSKLTFFQGSRHFLGSFIFVNVDTERGEVDDDAVEGLSLVGF